MEDLTFWQQIHIALTIFLLFFGASAIFRMFIGTMKIGNELENLVRELKEIKERLK